MKVTLISTDSDCWGFGVRVLSSILKAAGHSPVLLFLGTEDAGYPAEVLSELDKIAATSDVIGLTCFSRGSDKAKQLARHLRCLGKPLIWGGLHATLNTQECAREVDIICRGEGEEALLELLGAIEAGRDWRQIRNLAFLEAGELRINAVRPPVKNLGDLPLFDFSRDNEFHLTRAGLKLALQDPAQSEPAQALAIGSRGCAFRCTYCCNEKLKRLYTGNGQYLRRLTPAEYVHQIERLHNDHFPNATDFFLIDEDFFMRPFLELQEFATLYKERVGIPFECMASPPRVTKEKLAVLADAGLWRIRLGVESGSERTKKIVYDRPIQNCHVLKAAAIIAEQRTVIAAYFFIIGNPYEERPDLLETIGLMRSIPQPYFAQVFNLVFFPGSALYSKAIADGIITGASDSGFQLHYRSGFEYRQHSWKQRNVYLNTLIFLMEGKITRHRLGLLPRVLLGPMVRPMSIRLAERLPVVCDLLVGLKSGVLKGRRLGGAVLKRIMKDPAGVYDLRLYFRRTAKEYAARLFGT